MPYAYCYRCPLGLQYPDCGIACADYVERTIENPEGGIVDAGSLIVEPAQGSRMVVPPDGYFQKIRKICDKHNLIFIADEIQSGMGRTGKMYGLDHSGVAPDVIVLGKGIANGFPISLTMGKSKYFEGVSHGQHTSTFGGNPMACAAANATLDYIERNNLINRVEKVGEYFMHQLLGNLQKAPNVGDIRGKGFFVGIEIVKDKQSKEPASREIMAKIIGKMVGKGLIPLATGNVIRLLPPYITTKDQLDVVVRILAEVLSENYG